MTEIADVDGLNLGLVPRVELEEIRVLAMSCDSFAPTPDDGPIYLTSRITGGFNDFEEGCTTHITVRVEARAPSEAQGEAADDSPPDDDNGEEVIWAAEVTVGCDWLLVPDAEPATKDEWNALSRIQGVLAAYPYARQQVQYLSTSMGFPPATLDLIRPHATPFAQTLNLQRNESE